MNDWRNDDVAPLDARRWLMRVLEPTSKADRLANYVVTMRKEILQLSQAIGVDHPGDVTLGDSM